jgi:cell division protein FtsI/penicillin-binding protein 2
LSRVLVGGFVIAALSQARVQLLERGSIIDRASETDRFMVSRIEYAHRGGIYSSDGKPVAQDEDTRVLTVEFTKVPHSAAFFMDVAAATGIPASEFLQLADANVRSRTWREPISAAQAKALQDVKNTWRADGISLSRSGRRNYPLGESTSCFVGVLRDGKPQGGLELGTNKLLSGENGKKVGLVDRTGAFLPMRLDSKTVQRVDGQAVTLTIDSELQLAATSSLKQAVESNKADQGVAIVIDPKTGDLLAMANWPSYDPNTMGEAKTSGDRASDFNPNYMATLEPGSMFKILTLAKALDKGVLHLHDTVFCHGTLGIGKRTISCDSHHGNRAHGLLDPTLAIAKSCNVSAATWALRVGYDDYVKYMEKLGIMSKTHLGVPGERRGLFNYNEYAKTLQLATLGFGQSVNATPIELASAFAMLGNNGLRMEPRLIKKIGVQEQPLRPAGQIVSAQTTKEVLHIMRSVIESDAGTGKDLRIPGYVLGGKTGTAQKMNRQTRSMKGGGYVSNFVGFVPAEQPRAVILVMVDNPKAGKYYGASVAGPVFVQLAKSVIRRFDIPPSTAAEVTKANAEAEKTRSAALAGGGENISSAEAVAKAYQAEQQREDDAQVEVPTPLSSLTPQAKPTPTRNTEPVVRPQLEEMADTFTGTQMTDTQAQPTSRRHHKRHRR